MSTRVMPSVRTLRDRPAWRALEKHYGELEGKHLRELFAEDATRGEAVLVEDVTESVAKVSRRPAEL